MWFGTKLRRVGVRTEWMVGSSLHSTAAGQEGKQDQSMVERKEWGFSLVGSSNRRGLNGPGMVSLSQGNNGEDFN